MDNEILMPVVPKKRRNGEGSLYLFKISGDCMEPTIRSGDVVIANTREKKIIDSLYLLDRDGKIGVRRLQNCFDGHIRIICDNPLYGPSNIVERKKLNIIGRCAGIMKRI